ncbi:MAG: flagellar biosynthesis protein FlhA [Planctomycetaceae bacterium]|nr:flagellar biosynthesis protein FlhA [Planctomycetaceae bacterium]
MSENKELALATELGGGRGPMARVMANNDVILAVALATVLATLLIPLPTFLLDLLLSCSIAVSIATMVIVLSARESIEFSTFPSLLLFVTLFRLSLNVASTRLILLQGDAGKIIETFGNFVVGGNLVIGLVIFLILVIIQFVVITKGAERISEVAARFNLDAMPGKQMAIDADLNAGLIGDTEAKARRKKIVSESEFYGAMDGASKFIRGDAVAGLVIVAVNLVGGIIVGMTRGMNVSEAIKSYSILAIGDGLVSQIPALIISTSSGFLISKTSTQSNLSQDLIRQMLRRSRPIAIAAALLGAMVLVPGFPKIPFIVLAGAAGLLAGMLHKQEKAQLQSEAAATATGPTEAPPEELLDVDAVAVQVGMRLVKLVDPRRKTSLPNRVVPLRKKFVQQLGIVLPLVRLRDNVTLEPNDYEIQIHGHTVARGTLELEKFLAMDPGTVASPVAGQSVREPVFNLPALWIDAAQKEQAELAGYTVVDPESILVTHLSEVLKRHAGQLLSRDDVQKLVDRLKQRQPSLVAGVIGEIVPLGLLQRVLKMLLDDGIAVRDLAQIVESLGDHASRVKDPVLLTELVRKSLVRTITEKHVDGRGKLMAVALEPGLEYDLRAALRREGEIEQLALPPERVMELVRAIGEQWKTAMEQGYDSAVLLCDGRLRLHLARLVGGQVPVPVVAYDEVAQGTAIESVGLVALQRVEGEGPVVQMAGG